MVSISLWDLVTCFFTKFRNEVEEIMDPFIIGQFCYQTITPTVAAKLVGGNEAAVVAIDIEVLSPITTMAIMALTTMITHDLLS